MQCPEFDRRMQRLWDRRRPPADDAQLAAHALHCPRCARLLEARRLLEAGLARLERPACPHDLAQRAASALAAQASARPPAAARQAPAGRWAITAAAAAAALALAVGTLRQPNRSAPPPGPNRPGPQAPQRPDRPLAGVEPNARPPAAPSAALSPPAPRWAVAGGPAENLPFDSADLRPLRELADSIQPIADSFSLAFSALRRTVGGRTRHPAEAPGRPDPSGPF